MDPLGSTISMAADEPVDTTADTTGPRFRTIDVGSSLGRYQVIEELGVYDPHVADKAARVKLKPARIKYWKSVGATASDQCEVLFTKFMKKWEEIEAQEAAKAAEDAARAAQPAPATA